MDSVDVTNTITTPMNNIGAAVFFINGTCFNLTRQVLMDSIIENDEHTFFYDILSMDPDMFNRKYDRHAYFQNVKYGTANILLNVDIFSFGFIIRYLITGEERGLIGLNNWFLPELEAVRNLAGIFGMDKLVTYIDPLIANLDNTNSDSLMQ